MDNMSRQYRKEKGIRKDSLRQESSVRNINAVEESLLLGVMKNNIPNTNDYSTRRQNNTGVKKINLEDLVGHSKQSTHQAIKQSSAISLDELAKKQSK